MNLFKDGQIAKPMPEYSPDSDVNVTEWPVAVRPVQRESIRQWQ